jgi:ADP-heptose:LPS heptosyltransferase
VQRLLVARFHSLGDVVLSTGLVARLNSDRSEVSVATSESFRSIFEGLPVHEIRTPRDFAGAKDREISVYDRVVDLQANATSRRLLAGSGPSTRVRSRSFARRWMVFWGRRRPAFLIPHCVQRYAEAAGCMEDDPRRLRPQLVVTDRDRAEAEGLPLSWAATGAVCVGLAPGASRGMKRWPAERFRALEAALAGRGLTSLRFEEPDGEECGEGAGFVRASLRPLKALLARCSVLVTNDSGMMHMAVGLGVPVVAIFGSTVAEFGFGPLGDRDTVLERDLDCRPCAPHGARFCWQGHGACLRGVTVDAVLAAVLERIPREVPR